MMNVNLFKRTQR